MILKFFRAHFIHRLSQRNFWVGAVIKTTFYVSKSFLANTHSIFSFSLAVGEGGGQTGARAFWVKSVHQWGPLQFFPNRESGRWTIDFIHFQQKYCDLLFQWAILTLCRWGGGALIAGAAANAPRNARSPREIAQLSPKTTLQWESLVLIQILLL